MLDFMSFLSIPIYILNIYKYFFKKNNNIMLRTKMSE